MSKKEIYVPLTKPKIITEASFVDMVKFEKREMVKKTSTWKYLK